MECSGIAEHLGEACVPFDGERFDVGADVHRPAGRAVAFTDEARHGGTEDRRRATLYGDDVQEVPV